MTILCQVESCLNSRPLVAMTSHSPDGIRALTPGHFLTGRELCACPEMPIEVQPSLLRRWNLCQSIVQQFWKRWSGEYIQQLQRLQKWTSNLREGDVVVIRDDHQFTNRWPLGQVVKVILDKTALSELHL